MKAFCSFPFKEELKKLRCIKNFRRNLCAIGFLFSLLLPSTTENTTMHETIKKV